MFRDVTSGGHAHHALPDGIPTRYRYGTTAGVERSNGLRRKRAPADRQGPSLLSGRVRPLLQISQQPRSRVD